MKEDDHNGVSIHAGFPNPAADKSFSSLDLHQLLVERPSSTFLFRIAGTDWESEGIFDGDIAIIDRALDPRPSDRIVWWDDTTGAFHISLLKRMPDSAACWGVITATVHQFRKK